MPSSADFTSAESPLRNDGSDDGDDGTVVSVPPSF